MMSLIETYIFLFIDTLFSNIAFNVSSEIAIYSMKIFEYNKYHITLIASFAFFISSCINYIFGIICYNILAPFQVEKKNKEASNIEKVRNSKYIILFLTLSVIPFFGKFIILFAGFCKVRPLFSISIGSFFKFIYYFIFI